jgi:hypothetical protein
MVNWLTGMTRGLRLAAWYAGFALYAAGVALFSGLGQDHWWGTWAAGGYAVAAATALMARRSARGGRRLVAASVGVSVAGALIAPTAWLMATAQALPDVTVVARSGVLLLHHGTPYLPVAALASGGWLAYNPYLPVMALFGLPGALGIPGGTRPALIVATFLVLYATFRVLRVPGWAALGWAAFALSCPIMAFPLTMGITDPPVIALTCLALALLARRPGPGAARAARRGLVLAAVVLGVACAMKYTAWPALAVTAVMVTTRDGMRAGIAFAGTVLGTAAALVAALAPAALPHPAAIVANTIAYPLGLTTAKSPAQSPLPGHLLATLGPGGHLAAIALLAVAGLAIAASLVLAPPATPAAAAIRIAIGLTALFALCPATRWGYFIYPLALVALAALEHSRRGLPETAASAADQRQLPGLGDQHAGRVPDLEVLLVVAAGHEAGVGAAGQPAGRGPGAHVDGQLNGRGARAELQHRRRGRVNDERQRQCVSGPPVGEPYPEFRVRLAGWRAGQPAGHDGGAVLEPLRHRDAQDPAKPLAL